MFFMSMSKRYQIHGNKSSSVAYWFSNYLQWIISLQEIVLCPALTSYNNEHTLRTQTKLNENK